MTVVDETSNETNHVSTAEKLAPTGRNRDGGGGRDGSAVFVAMIAFLVLLVGSVVAIGLIALLTDVGDSDGSAAAATTVDVALTEFSIDGQLTAPEGEVTLAVSNNGSVEHNLAVRELGESTPMIAAGGSATLALGDLPAGTYQLFCEVAGHEGSGMSAELVITAGGEAAAESETADAGDATGSGTADMAGMDHTQMSDEEMAAMEDQLMVDSMLAYPAETEGVGNQLLDYRVMPDGTKQFELTAAVTPWEVSPGKIVDAWAYNGMVPGPTIKVDVGDKVRVIVHNETPMGTDIHWHGIMVPNGQDGVSPFTQDVIATGDSYTYEFTVDHPAIAMYHAHMHSQVSVPNGMFAAFIVGDNPIPYGKTIAGVTIPDDLVAGRRDADGAQRRRSDRAVAQRQELPGDGPTRSEHGRLGVGDVLQRGADGAPDAPAHVPPTRLRQGRHPARRAVLGRHDQRGPRRALFSPLPGDGARYMGLALPHPHPRRRRSRHVRHGHRRRRPGPGGHLSDERTAR